MKYVAYGLIFTALLLGQAAYANEWADVATRTTLTAGKWCTTDGTDISCTEDAPGGAIDALDDIGDVDATSPSTNDILSFDGSNWVSQDDAILTKMRLTPNVSAGSGYTPSSEGELTISWDGNATITGGTIDNTEIGGTTAAAGSFTTIAAAETIQVGDTTGGCTTSADYGKMKFDSSTKKMYICRP